ncbi:hypothetical protein ACFQAT_04485 [Undibacterium arcticum]
MMPANLNVSGAVVNYTEGAQGDIDRIWILTREEAALPAPGETK